MKFLVSLIISILVLACEKAHSQDWRRVVQPSKYLNPTSPIPAGLVLWLNSDTINSANGSIVTSWTDLSGFGHDFTNTFSLAPYVTNGVVNGHPAIRNLANTASFLQANTNFLGNSTTGEMFIVCRALDSLGGPPWDFSAPTPSGASAHPFTDWKMYENFGLKTSLSGVQLTNIAFPTNWHIWHVAVASNYFMERYNGNLIAGRDFQSGGVGFNNNLRIGRDNSVISGWNGEIAEFVVYDKSLSVTERQWTHSYLSSKYNIPLTNADTVYPPSGFQGLLAWWDPSQMASNHNDAVTTWPDLSGFGNNWITTGDSGKRATFHTNVQNGRSALWFNSTRTNYYTLAAQLAITNIYTIIAVHRATNNTRIMWSRTAVPFIQVRYRESGNNAMLLYNGSAGTTSSSGPQTVGQWQMDVIQNTGFYQNTMGQSASQQSGPYRIDVLGAGDPALTYSGYIGELCIFTNTLPVDAINKLYYTYFRPKWDLP
jgi:hypothetical protein